MLLPAKLIALLKAHVIALHPDGAYTAHARHVKSFLGKEQAQNGERRPVRQAVEGLVADPILKLYETPPLERAAVLYARSKRVSAELIQRSARRKVKSHGRGSVGGARLDRGC